MTFVLANKRPAFDWTVRLEVPDPKKPGKHLVQTFTARFDPLTPEEEEELDAANLERLEKALETDVKAGAAAMRQLAESKRETADREKELLRRIWIGWGKDLVDQDNKPISFSEDLREQLIARRDIRAAVVAAYNEAMNPAALKGARRGN